VLQAVVFRARLGNELVAVKVYSGTGALATEAAMEERIRPA
jgi:hypothetical protein